MHKVSGFDGARVGNEAKPVDVDGWLAVLLFCTKATCGLDSRSAVHERACVQHCCACVRWPLPVEGSDVAWVAKASSKWACVLLLGPCAWTPAACLQPLWEDEVTPLASAAREVGLTSQPAGVEGRAALREPVPAARQVGLTPMLFACSC